MNKEFFTYAKYDGMKNFIAFDVNEGVTVTKKIYATLVEDTARNRTLLQEMADENKEIQLKLQLRDMNGKVVFETK